VGLFSGSWSTTTHTTLSSTQRSPLLPTNCAPTLQGRLRHQCFPRQCDWLTLSIELSLAIHSLISFLNWPSLRPPFLVIGCRRRCSEWPGCRVRVGLGEDPLGVSQRRPLVSQPLGTHIHTDIFFLCQSPPGRERVYGSEWESGECMWVYTTGDWRAHRAALRSHFPPAPF